MCAINRGGQVGKITFAREHVYIYIIYLRVFISLSFYIYKKLTTRKVTEHILESKVSAVTVLPFGLALKCE